MGAKVANYVDFISNYALYGENGYYIDSFVIKRMIVDELKLPMSFNEIKEFVNTCEISLSEEEIKEFLDKRMNEEHPDLKEKTKTSSSSPKDLCKITKKDIKKDMETFNNFQLSLRYTFEPSSLQEFKDYIFNLKVKCTTLFEILEDLLKSRKETISKEAWSRINDLDFHINQQGNIYYTDAERLADAIIHNVKDLYDKVNQGNNLETYLIFKGGLHLPSRKVQIKNLSYSYCKEFIALSKQQEEILMQERLDDISKMIEEDFLEDDEMYLKNKKGKLM